MVLTGATLWGLSSAAAQRLFQEEGITPIWLVTVRLLASGILLLVIALFRNGINLTFNIWRYSDSRRHLLVFSLIGMLGVQYTYFVAIQVSNASTATLLQSQAPLFIVIYLSLKYLQIPNPRIVVAMFFSTLGTYLLVINGETDSLVTSLTALFWGASSAAALAFYTLYAAKLLKQWNSEVVVGWGMFIGGSGLCLLNPPWQNNILRLSPLVLVLIAFIVLFGTLIAFYLYIDSLRFITSTEASLLLCAEPLSATTVSVLWLNMSLSIFNLFGITFLVIAVAALSFRIKPS